MPSDDFFFESDLRVLKDGIDFVRCGAEAAQYFGLNFDRADDMFFGSLIDLSFELIDFVLKHDLAAGCVFLENVAILCLFLKEY